ncbi:DUF7661 family protein [Massilia sp. CFBP9012]|uniref:DUF7661 family protein n=1 Tax=Massilia sp. CFBP9012 TaxID=3096531 RepID=UPI003BB9467D
MSRCGGDEGWVAYRSESRERARIDELVIPPELDARDLTTKLDDVFREYPGSVKSRTG